MKKQLTAHVIFAATALASQQAWALGFGRAVSDAVLGQSLTFTVPLHVDPGEHIGLECLTAQVYYGEAQLPSSQVRTDLQPGTGDYAWIVKVTANAPVAEPIVEVALNAHCDRPFTRRFSLFADPPSLGATLPQIAPASTARTPAARTAEAAPAAGYSVAAPAAQAGASGAAGPRARVVRKGPTMALANDIEAPAAAPSRRHVVVADAGRARKPGPRAVPAPSAEETARLVLDPGVPHLKLDMEEPVVPAAPAASGARIGLSDIDDPDIRQLKALEQSIASIRNDSQLQHERADRLQAQLARAQSHGDWAPWLLGLLAIAAAAIAALLWKLREQNRSAHSDWFNQSQLSVLPSATPEPEAEPAVEPPPAAPAAAVRRETPAPVAAPLEDALPDLPAIDDGDARGVPDLAATRPLDRQAMVAAMVQDSAPRELSVEELLDLEQQADFFIALGQEDAAVDLLMSHLRSAGGQSPIPYTKLLEIYKRQGDRSAYERIRARFNRRFNAYAPDWDTGPTAGRSLEDYPDTLALLERAWGSPIDAMAILEALLFKRDDTSELFDLPAYRDVLMLYSLARDLWQNGVGQGSAQIDVLLPLDDASDAGYPSAREVNERAMPKRDGGLDLGSVDAEGDTAHGMLTSFELTGFDSGSRDSHLDLELPPGEAQVEGADVHVTLDERSLSPSIPARPKASPHERRDSETPDPDLPTKR
jgi:pilus assembly protein FimV